MTIYIVNFDNLQWWRTDGPQRRSRLLRVSSRMSTATHWWSAEHHAPSRIESAAQDRRAQFSRDGGANGRRCCREVDWPV